MDRASNQNGFTLLEVLAVLAIATLLLAIALPRTGMNASPAATEAIAMRVIAMLADERYTARRRSITLTTELDPKRNQIIGTTQSAPMILPATITLDSRAAPACEPTGRYVIFYPDGTACAPLIELRSATALRTISVNSLTGAISLVP